MEKRKNLRAAALAAVTLSTLFAGCSTGSEPTTADERMTLKVMYYDERSYYQQYGMLFSALHPNIDVEVVSQQTIYQDNNSNEDMLTKTKKFIEEQKPDIIMTDSQLYRQLAEDGKLLDLETMVQEKSFKPESIVPGILDYLREQGGGKLYGLSPNIYAQAIFYNKDLFIKHGVDAPRDGMSWDELFALAKRFPTDGDKDSRVYGLSLGYASTPFQLASMIGSSQNLSMINPADMQVTLDTPAWTKAFESSFQALKSDALYLPDGNGWSGGSYEEYLLQDPFISGKVAMKLESYYMMDQIKEAQQYPAVKDKVLKDWGIVTMPVDPQFPDSSPNVGLSSLFSVNAQSQSQDAAKQFIAYVTSEEFARVSSKAQMSGLSIRTTAYDDPDNRNLKAFYALKPMINPLSNLYGSGKVPDSFLMQMDGIVQGAVQSAYDDAKPLKEALAEAQTQLQAALLQAQQDKPASGEASSSAEASEGVSVQSVTVTK